MNDKVKIKDKKTGAIKEVKKTLASDFLGTGKFVLVDEKETKVSTSFIKKSQENSGK